MIGFLRRPVPFIGCARGDNRHVATDGPAEAVPNSLAALMVAASPACCSSAGITAACTAREFDERSGALLEHIIREKMEHTMQLKYSYWRDKLCWNRGDASYVDGWCEGIREQWRGPLRGGADLDTSSARVVSTAALDAFLARQQESGIVPVIAFHTTRKDEARAGILEKGFLPAKDAGTEHFGNGIHFNQGFPRFPGHDFDCFGRHHFLCLLLLDPAEISATKYNFAWSISSGVVTVNDATCMLPVIVF